MIADFNINIVVIMDYVYLIPKLRVCSHICMYVCMNVYTRTEVYYLT